MDSHISAIKEAVAIADIHSAVVTAYIFVLKR